MRQPILICAVTALALTMTACAAPVAAPALPTIPPVETAVALTLQALPTTTPYLSTEEPAPQPTAAPNVLPRPLLFINKDAGGLWQIYRIGVDGQGLQQLTYEPLNVDAYDVSPVDGSLAYVTNNQLYLVDANGAGRRMLVDGGPVDDNNRWTNSLSAPVWAPNAKTLAYGHGGLSFLDLAGGAANKVLQNQVDLSQGFPIVQEIYAPRAYSADGNKLLIDIGYYEGGTYGIYLPANNALVRFQREDGGIVCCYAGWIPDGSGVYITSPSLGMVESGLYYADAATGNVSALLPGAASDATYNFAYGAQVGADNKLYFFFSNLPEIPFEGHTPLTLVRSEPDGVTGREQVLPDVFDNLNEALWAPDASLVVLTIAADPNEYSGGEARVVYLDGRPAVTLLPFARSLRWAP